MTRRPGPAIHGRANLEERDSTQGVGSVVGPYRNAIERAPKSK
jgi:hypothetical protein